MNNHKLSSTILLALFFLVILSNSLLAQPGENSLEKLIHVDAQPFMTQGGLSHGYYVFRCKIQNQDAKPHKVTLVSENVATRSFDLPPGETINASLALPVTNPKFDNEIQVHADNRKLYSIPCPMSKATRSHIWPSSYVYRSIYVPEDISSSTTFLICRSLRKQFTEADCLFAEKDCQYWPQDRMDYSCLDVILLTPEELALAPSGVQTALRQFVLSGGILWLFECNVQKEALEKIDWITQLKKEATLKADDNSQNLIFTRYPLGFGIVAMTDSISSGIIQELFTQNESDKEVLSVLFDEFGFKPLWYEKDRINELQKYFPVVKDLSIPVMGIGIVIFLFVLLAGPINLFFLSKRNKRIWLLVTVPVLSFLFAGAILLYVILSDGFTTEVRVSAVATLDQRSGMYASLSQYGIYARTTPRNVVFDSDDELNISDNDEAERLNIDWTSGKQVIHSHFATARKPAYYKIRKTGTTRLKLDFDFNGDNPYVVNGLGKNVELLYVRDPNGNLWKAENIVAGQKAALTAVNMPYDENLSKNTLFTYCITTSQWDVQTAFKNTKEYADFICPGSYIATFSSSGPFVNAGISYAKEKISYTFLLGRF